MYDINGNMIYRREENKSYYRALYCKYLNNTLLYHTVIEKGKLPRLYYYIYRNERKIEVEERDIESIEDLVTILHI